MSTTLYDLLQFTVSGFFILVAGTILAKASDKISEKTGLGRLFVGGLFLAGATSLPEFMVDLKAIEIDRPDLAVGDLLGSSLFNLLALAVLDLLFRFPRKAFSHDSHSHALTATLSVLLTGMIGIGIVYHRATPILGVSPFLWSAGILYIWGLRLVLNDHEEAPKPISPQEASLGRTQWLAELWKPIGAYLIGALTILVAAPFMVNAADRIATETGMGHTFIGTTLIAFSTSLPELVATLASFRIGQPDLALGNIFGSNAFNMLLFLPLDAIFPPSLLASVQQSHALTAFVVVVVSAIAVISQLYRRKDRSRFFEPGAFLMLISIFLGLALLYRVRG